jgi:hypothetical protein
VRYPSTDAICFPRLESFETRRSAVGISCDLEVLAVLEKARANQPAMDNSIFIPPVDPAKGDLLPMSDAQIAEWTANGQRDYAVLIIDCVDSYAVCTPETVWVGHSPVMHLRVREVISCESPDLYSSLVEAGKKAAQARRRSLKKCKYCKQTLPPEHGDGPRDDFACHGCMTQHMGIIF